MSATAIRRVWISSLALAILAAVVGLGISVTAYADDYPAFTSLSDDDPVIEGGITQAMVDEWIASGYTVTLKTTTVDHHNMLVQFRNPETSALEWRIGTIPSGTEYYVVQSNMGFNLGPDTPVKECGNKVADTTPLPAL